MFIKFGQVNYQDVPGNEDVRLKFSNLWATKRFILGGGGGSSNRQACYSDKFVAICVCIKAVSQKQLYPVTDPHLMKKGYFLRITLLLSTSRLFLENGQSLHITGFESLSCNFCVFPWCRMDEFLLACWISWIVYWRATMYYGIWWTGAKILV